MQDFSSFSTGQAAPFSVSWTMFLDLVLVPSPQVTLHFGEHLYNKRPIYMGIAQIALIAFILPSPLCHPGKPSWQAFWPSESKITTIKSLSEPSGQASTIPLPPSSNAQVMGWLSKNIVGPFPATKCTWLLRLLKSYFYLILCLSCLQLVILSTWNW